MSVIVSVLIGLIPGLVACGLMAWAYEKRIKSIIREKELLLSQKKSSEVRLGQISEQLAPMLEGFKYDPRKAHFIGNPIDYIIFEEDEIVILEVKSGESRMTKKQRDIRDMINNGKVRFETMQIK